MTDINKQIEEEARAIEYKQEVDLYSDIYEGLVGYEYAYDLMVSLKIEAYKNGYNKALHSSRWRKVSEDEFPEIDTAILCKFRVGSMQPSIQYRVSTLLKSGRFSGETDWVSVVEWKYID